MDARNVVIIGSGPSGYTAAIYNARAELKPLMLAGEKAGGQLMLTTEVENWPGAKDGVMGPELMMAMRAQAEKFGTEIVDKYVTAVDFSQRPFKIWIRFPNGFGPDVFAASGDQARVEQMRQTLMYEGNPEYLANSVIVSTGAEAKLLGIPGEKELLGKGVSTCAVCDAAFYRDKVTFVVGGGDAAAEEVMALVKFAKSVTMVVRRDQLRASKIMAKRVSENPKVNMVWNSEAREVKGADKVGSVVIENIQTKEKKEYPTDGLFVAVGHRPMTDVFRGVLELDEKGYLVTHLNSLKAEVAEKTWLEGYPTETSVEGVFGAGDVVDFRYRQAVTAAGYGCMAALDAERWLGKQG